MGLNALLDELKRRRVFRTAAVYAATAFVVWQAADIAIPALHLPAWLVTAVVALTIIGFPVALVLAWAFEVTPAGVQRTPADSATADVVDMRWLPARTIALVTVLLAVGVGVGWILKPGPTAPAGSAATERPTLAVLPFTNLGAPDDEYFADGMSDALRGKLAGIEGIGVIASASSRPYKGSDKPPQQIGRELAVQYLLTGTVHWAKSPDGSSRVQVRPELVVAETGTTPWQQPFDAVLADVFEVQGEIATRVADALRVSLLEPQRRSLAERPTRNLDAYDAFLRATALLEQAELGAPLRRRAADGFHRAVELDPRFALAWAQLGYAHMGAFWFGEDRADATARLALARSAIDSALALQPSLPEALIADAYYWYWGWRSYDRALTSLERARSIDPANARIEAALGNVLRRQGRFAESLEHKRRALALDPRNAMLYREVGVTAAMIGELALADSTTARAVTLAPDAVGGYVFRANALYAKEDTAAAANVLSDARRVLGNERFIIELVNRSWTRWVAFTDVPSWRVLQDQPLSPAVVDTGNFLIFRAEWLQLAGRAEHAAALADTALPYLRRYAQESTDDWWHPGQLALAHALAGRNTDAVTALGDARAVLRRAPDAWDQPEMLFHAAKVALLLGDHDAALGYLEEQHRSSARVAAAQIGADLRFAALRSHPRFQRLVGRP